MIRISALYPNEAGSFFDAAYYRGQHEPFAAIDGSSPPFWAISEMVFTSRPAFDAAMARCGERLFADIPNYTNVSPVLQVSDLGEAHPDPTGA